MNTIIPNLNLQKAFISETEFMKHPKVFSEKTQRELNPIERKKFSL